MKSSNPMLKEDSFNEDYALSEPMTIGGTIFKTFLMAVLLVLAGAFSWQQASQALAAKNLGITQLFIVGGSIGGLVLAILTAFKKNWAPFTAPLYAVAEGLLLGALSLFFELRYPGIAVQATLCTVSALFAMLFVYRTGLIKVTEKFRSVLVIATAGIALLYLVTFALSFFNINVPYIHQSGLIGIGFSVFVIVVAALNLLLDFDFIERASLSGQVPKYMEWYGAFGLMVTLVWLYIEFLRLLSKLRDRR